MVNLRIKERMSGEGAFMGLNHLYYLSCHTLDNPENVKFAKARLARELVDRWVEKKFSFGGLCFDDSEVVLTDEVSSLNLR